MDAGWTTWLRVDFTARTRTFGAISTSTSPSETFVTRLDAYNNQTAPLLPYYEGQGKLSEIDGMGSVEAVAAEIDQVLG